MDSAVFALPEVAAPLPAPTYEVFAPETPLEAEVPPARFRSRPPGIDVSAYQHVKGKPRVPQPVATFQYFARLGKVFAIARSSQDVADPTFRGHYANIRAAGLIRGSFHFFTPFPVADQVRLFLGLVPRLEPGDLAPALDIEDPEKNMVLWNHYRYPWAGKGGTAAGATKLLDDVQKWLDEVEAALGRTPIVYTGVMWRDGLRSNRMGQYPLWTFEGRLPMGAWRREEIIQYGEGPEPSVGLEGVDYDVYNGTIYGLRGLADLGRVGVALTPVGAAVAHAEPDRHIHLLHGAPWTDTDLMQGALPGLGGDPTLVARGLTLRMYFRSDGRVIEATQTAPGANWDVEDLSGAAGATAVQEPRALAAGDRRFVVFTGDDNDWHLLSRTDTTPWTATALLASTRGTSGTTVPPASGQPTIYLDRAGASPRVVGRAGPLGHLVELDLGPSGWVATDLTATAVGPHGSPPGATYSPAVYHGPSDTFVVYRALRGELWQIARGTRRATNLSAAAVGNVAAVGHPVCFVLGGDVHVVYRGNDQGIHALRFRGGTWTDSRLPCPEPAAADPTCAADGTTALVAFRAMDGRVRMLRCDGSTWTCEDTVAPTTPAPPPVPSPVPSPGGQGIFAALGAEAGRFRELVAAGDDRSAVALARRHGVHDDAAVTDLVFFGRHPELGGRRLRADESALVREWRTLRERVTGTAVAETESEAGSGSGWLRALDAAVQGEGIGAAVHDAGRLVGDVLGGAVDLLTKAMEAPFAEFLRRMDGLDRSAVADGYDLAARVTAFRKIFYDSRGGSGYTGGAWNLLIPGAAAVKPPPSWAAAAADVTYLRDHPEQVTRGARVDIGHLLTGLDARHHPTDVTLGVLGFPVVRLRSNLEATTFAGDLGSVVVEYIHSSKRSFRDTAMEQDVAGLDTVYDRFAGAADMAADADAHLLALQPTLGLAANLAAYYTAGTGGVRRRWHGFVDRIGLGTFTPASAAMGPYLQTRVIGTFSGSTERWRTDMQGEIMSAALAYAAAKGHRSDVVNVLADPGPGIVTPTFWELYWNVSGWTLEEFLRRLKTAVKGETPTVAG